MRRYPGIYNADWLVKHAGQCAAGLPDGRWVAARPLAGSFRWQRLRAAWLVWTGRADALTWTAQEE